MTKPDLRQAEQGPALDNQNGSGVAHHIFKTSKVDELENSLSSLVVSQRLVPLKRESLLDSEFRFDGVGDLGAFHVRFGRSLAVEFPSQETDDRLNNVFFVMAKTGSGQLIMAHQQYAIAGKMGVVFTSGLPRTMHYLQDCDAQVLTMNRHKIVECCMKLLGREIDETNLKFDAVFALDDASGRSWTRLVEYATAELGDPRSLIRSSPTARSQLEQMVMTGLLLGHSHSYSEALLRPQSPAAPYYVKRAEAYIEHHFADALSLADIAAHAGVSARSLQNGFRMFRNMTPMEFLRAIRLKNAHANLLMADPKTTTTTDIAMRSGFSHMGEFAALYKKFYGTSPSHTLMKTA
jgi:AraC-like DNA-binding protein